MGEEFITTSTELDLLATVVRTVLKPRPKRILRSEDYTHVFWMDGTKTTVKRQEGAVDNPYSAFTAALAIKIYGNNSAVNRLIDRTYEEQYRDPDTGKMKKCNTPEDRKKLRKYMKERKKREKESD